MQNFREKAVSLFGAALVCAGVLLLSSFVMLWDLSAFRQKVEQFFSVDLFKVPAPLPDTPAPSADLAGKQLVGESIGLFAKPPETPEVDTRLPENLPVPEMAQIPQPAQAIAGLTLPEAELPQLAGLELRKGGGGEEDILALRRKLPAGAEAAGNAGEGNLVRQGGQAGSSRLARELPKAPDFAPALPEQPAPVELSEVPQPKLAGENFLLPSGGGGLMRDLARFRPAGGYPSLDREILAEFALEPSRGENFFRLSFRLRPESRLPVLPKDVLFLVDVSQSIGLEQIKAAREAIATYVRQLRPDDRWNVVKFSERVYTLSPGFVFLPAGREEFAAAAEKFVKRIPGEDMTDLFEATRSILKNVPESDRPCNVFLLSDGFANYNRKEVGQITDGFSRVKRENVSIFTFLSGDFGKPDLLRLLSYRSRGFFEQRPLGEGLARQMLAFFQAYDRPVLADCVANYTNLETSDVYPQVLPNLYAGQAVTFYGRARNAGDFVVRVMGLGENGQPREFYFRPQGARVQAGSGIRPEWAMGRAYGMVQDIMDAPEEAQKLRELQAFRTFIAAEGLTDLQTMGRLLEKGR